MITKKEFEDPSADDTRLDLFQESLTLSPDFHVLRLVIYIYIYMKIYMTLWIIPPANRVLGGSSFLNSVYKFDMFFKGQMTIC